MGYRVNFWGTGYRKSSGEKFGTFFRFMSMIVEILVIYPVFKIMHNKTKILIALFGIQGAKDILM